MTIHLFSRMLLSLTLLALASCAQAGQYDDLPTNESPATEPVQPETLAPEQPSETPAIEAQPVDLGKPAQPIMPRAKDMDDELITRAKADLANRLGVTVDQVELISALKTVFTAQAFFCQTVKERITRDAPPETIEGQFILLAAAGKKYEYHANDTNLVFCHRPQNILRP